MPRVWIKFPETPRPYVEWTTVSDGPVRSALTQEEFDLLRDAEIKEAQRYPSRCPEVQRLREELIHAQWDQKQRELNEYGTTAAWRTEDGYEFQSPEQILAINFCGQHNTRLTYQQFMDWYCSGEDTEPPMGQKPDDR